MRVNLLLVGEPLNPNEVGWYSLGLSFTDIIVMLPATAGTMWFSELSAIPDESKRWHVVRRATLAVGGITALVCALVAAVATPAIRWLYGNAFLPAASVLQLLLLGVVALSPTTILNNRLASAGVPMITVVARSQRR